MVKINVVVKISVPKGLEVEKLLSKVESDLHFADFKRPEKYYEKIKKPSRGILTKAQRVKVGRNEEAIVVRGSINKAQYSALQREAQKRTSPVISVWTDAPITFHSYDIDSGSRGTIDQILNYIEAKWVWAKGYRGAGIVIGVVDGGVHGCAFGDKMFTKNGDIDGWPPPETLEPTDSKPGDMTVKCHATTMAFDALSVCPDAKILDIGVGRVSPGPEGTLGLAYDAYIWAIDRFRSNRSDGPHVLLNSWGVHPECDPDYARNPDHYFTQAVREAIRAGILVCFSAGNCGQVCPSPECTTLQNIPSSDLPCIAHPSPNPQCLQRNRGVYKGPDCSIWGANGLPEVITVGAESNRDLWFGYSSQGRSWLCLSLGSNTVKPDLCAPAEFQGYRNTLDHGTSAANALVAGVLGLLAEIGEKTQNPITQAEAKRHLIAGVRTDVEPAPPTPNDPQPGGVLGHSWGNGLLNARGAYQSLTNDLDPPDVQNYQAAAIFKALPCSNEPRDCRCFIATAAFGSSLDAHVQFLRDFRDDVVLTSSFAPSFQRLLDMYYKFSPHVAAKMQQNTVLKNLIKFTIVYPIISGLKAGVSIKRGRSIKRKTLSTKSCENNV